MGSTAQAGRPWKFLKPAFSMLPGEGEAHGAIWELIHHLGIQVS